MNTNVMLFIRLTFVGLFVATLVIGGYLLKNFDKFFGVDPEIPSENSSARSYTKIQVFGVWVHVLGLTGAFAFLLH